MQTIWIQGILGGLLIGTSATLLLGFTGRIAGLSNIFSRALFGARDERTWRWYFIGGLLMGSLCYEAVLSGAPTPRSELAPVAMIAGGFLVGMGTWLGNGCTSGHGVCGLGRLSIRSLVAVLTFMGTAFVTVWLVQQM